MDSSDYRVQTEFFDGPLDLLLHLIRKNKMDILEVRISEITSEYLYYLRNSPGLNPSREGDFLATAATLIYIKSRTLLPRFQENGDDTPEKQLIHSLIEYDKIQKISQLLRQMEGETMLLWKREDTPESFTSREFDLEEVSTFQLAEVFLSIIKKNEKEKRLMVSSRNYSVAKKRREITDLLDREGHLDFHAYLLTMSAIEEILVTFFSILEMVRQREIVAVQKKRFGTINVWSAPSQEAKPVQ